MKRNRLPGLPGKAALPLALAVLFSLPLSLSAAPSLPSLPAGALSPIETRNGDVHYGRVVDRGPDWIQAVGAGWTQKWYASELSAPTCERYNLTASAGASQPAPAGSAGLDATRSRLLDINRDYLAAVNGPDYPVWPAWPYGVSYTYGYGFPGYCQPAFSPAAYCPPNPCYRGGGGVRVSIKF